MRVKRAILSSWSLRSVMSNATAAMHAVLEHVVGGAALHRLDCAILSDGTGDEDKRDFRRSRAGDVQSREAVETLGHAEIGQDEIGTECLKRAFETLARVDPLRFE